MCLNSKRSQGRVTTDFGYGHGWEKHTGGKRDRTARRVRGDEPSPPRHGWVFPHLRWSASKCGAKRLSLFVSFEYFAV